MDLETENRIAAILMKEAAELRREAQQEGVLAYIRKPTVRGRPNSRFLTATVRGIQQANRAVEVSEMWQARKKELELDDKRKGKSRDEGINTKGDREMSRSISKRRDSDASCSSSKRSYEDYHSKDDEGLRDEEIEKFLHSRVKRGRGSVGSRMDETGPYLPPSFAMQDDYEKHRREFLGPDKPSSWKPCESTDEESDQDERKNSRKASSRVSKKKHSRKHKSEEKSKNKRKKRKETSHKH